MQKKTLIGVAYLGSSKGSAAYSLAPLFISYLSTNNAQCFPLLPQSLFFLPCSVSSSLVLLHWLVICSFCLLFCSVYLADLFLLRLVAERTRGLYFTFSTVTSSDYSVPPAVRKWFPFTTSAYDDYCFLIGYACQTLHLQHFFYRCSMMMIFCWQVRKSYCSKICVKQVYIC
jgi:hypothetical protein